MKRIILAIIAAIYANIMCAQSGVQWASLSLDEAIQEINSKNSEKDYVFLYLGTDIPYDPEMLECFKDETNGKYFNENFLCIMADAATEDGDALAKRLKVSAYPYFALFDKTGERQFANRTSNISSLIVRLDKRMAKLDSTRTIRHKYKISKDTTVAYRYLRLLKSAEDANGMGYFVSEFFNELTGSPGFWDVYKSCLSIEYMTMIDWTMEYRQSFRRAATLEQVNKDLAEVIVKGLKGYITGDVWGNKVTIGDASKYLQTVKIPTPMEKYILAMANARANENFIIIKQLCNRQNLKRYFGKEEILIIKDLFMGIDEITQEDKDLFLQIIAPLMEQ